jgi:hypothetical protein
MSWPLAVFAGVYVGLQYKLMLSVGKLRETMGRCIELQNRNLDSLDKILAKLDQCQEKAAKL